MELGNWELTEEFVHDYLGAVGDSLALYARLGLVPPVALAARALGSLLEQLELPPGAIHSLQEVSAIAPVAVGQVVTARASVGEPKRRGGMEFITAAVCLSDNEGNVVLSSKSTVLVVDPSSSDSNSQDSSKNGGVSGHKNQAESSPVTASKTGNLKSLPVVARTITQDRLNAYAQVSGDRNPLHLDARFAATTQFGGIIAHGMLTVAFISEMMAMEFQKPWLDSGAFRVRFKGAAFLGDSVETSGHVEKEETQPDGNHLTCTVGVFGENGQVLVSGTATLLNKLS